MDISLSNPQKCGMKVPMGRILVNKRWRGSSLCKELDFSDCQASFSDGMGYVDFFPSDSCAILYITEAELLAPRTFTERVNLLARDSKGKLYRGIIIVDECRSSGYLELQNLACIEHGLPVFPVAHQNEIPRVLRALTQVELRHGSNPFKNSLTSEEDMEKQQISLLKQIPSIGDEKAIMLLKSYGHITAISKLTEERLSFKIGRADAKKVYHYFRSKVS